MLKGILEADPVSRIPYFLEKQSWSVQNKFVQNSGKNIPSKP